MKPVKAVCGGFLAHRGGDSSPAARVAYPQEITLCCPLNIAALIDRGELLPRPLVAARDADEPSLGQPDLSE